MTLYLRTPCALRDTWTHIISVAHAFIVSTFFLCIRAVSSRNSGCLRQELPWVPRNVLLMLHQSWAQKCRAEFGTLIEPYFTTSTVALGAHPSSHSRSRIGPYKNALFMYLNRRLVVLGAKNSCLVYRRGSHWTNFHEIWHWGDSWKSVERLPSLVKFGHLNT
jgi:hypothetical protein